MGKWKLRNIVFLLLAVVLLVVGIYVAYVMISYKRIEDNQKLEIQKYGSVTEEAVRTGEEYTALTYNIGFGAYSADYSFFMDGGEYSRAYNKQAVLDNVNGSIAAIQQVDPDFVFLQEVDLKSTRSYGVNQKEMILEALGNVSCAFGVNYDSAYLLYPLRDPHGKSNSGIATISKFNMPDSIRRSLPIDTSLYKFIDLDRCYTITRVPVENGRYLCLYNVHLSAYTKEESIVENQIKMLSEDLQKDREAGNYIICGGDFNQDLLGNSPEIFHTPVIEDNWAKAFPTELLPEGINVVFEELTDRQRAELLPSCRNADQPYNEETTFVTMVDGFLISDNVQMVEVEMVDNQFAYSDHNPVSLKFILK